MLYSDIGNNMNKARVAEAARGSLNLIFLSFDKLRTTLSKVEGLSTRIVPPFPLLVFLSYKEKQGAEGNFL